MTDLLLILLTLAVYAALHAYLRFCARLSGGAAHRPSTATSGVRETRPNGGHS